ncbi:uncharacterized protein L3040_003281 [Drepanopeziza brunnea f. sp. 'multigermtubi']|uniref:Uncharacterized protein n=1 Tax=Marssonina brunnea f. sp. multigermtubi (strain MB_m1) TaxID=1072389 RepID=K1WS33_MARBU|nr:uncharacterized protein MBM_05872 [Drepanopeziza brunnea f. sp. 'multigermtubi' MB_m1]EKD15861.1 hypothetical protein MBM_05872 [Drepanopeziza brunnea f. sp. 'multigermtubi' MB_m1]KAJ5047454.1 hypothetical protein L3040_003281 [Drepanopeziza brunnea f. sp. 'multigermtubi']
MRLLPCLTILAVGLMAPVLAYPGPSPAAPSTGTSTLSNFPKPPVKTPIKPFQPDCAAILCIAEMQVVYDQTTGTCGCEWIPGFGPAAIDTRSADVVEVDPSTCPTIRCRAGYHALYLPSKKVCTCVPDAPDPSTCPTLECTSTTHPVYHPETKSCSCEPNALVCPNIIFCAAGSTKVQDPKTKVCACKITNPIPATCPLFKCVQGTHVVYHPETDKCSCDTDCPDLICIAEKQPVWDSATNSCSCQWIPGLEPSPDPMAVTARSATAMSTTPTLPPRPTARSPITSKPKPKPTIKPGPLPGCRDVFCISEQHPVFNATSGKCECEWIPGLEPSLIV